MASKNAYIGFFLAVLFLSLDTISWASPVLVDVGPCIRCRPNCRCYCKGAGYIDGICMPTIPGEPDHCYCLKPDSPRIPQPLDPECQNV
ncbi:hypothetical protein ACET3Z_019407 [Daucus carota]